MRRKNFDYKFAIDLLSQKGLFDRDFDDEGSIYLINVLKFPLPVEVMVVRNNFLTVTKENSVPVKHNGRNYAAFVS